MQTNTLGSGAVKKVGPDGFTYVGSKLVPRTGLREDAGGQTFGAIAPVRLLRYFEDQLVHAFIFALTIRALVGY